MKQILIGLIALTMFAGCSKDDNVPDTNQNYETLIQGNWQIFKESVKVYDVDSKVVMTQALDDAVGVKWQLKEGVITSQDAGEEGEMESGTYIVDEKAAPPTLQIKENSNEEGGQGDLTLLNITILNETYMVLEVNEDLSDFPESDELLGADHSVVKFELKRY